MFKPLLIALLFPLFLSIGNHRSISQDGTSTKKLSESEQNNRRKPSKEELQSAVIKALPDFRVETIYEVPLTTQGSWVSLAIDTKGRLIASDQGKEGLYRITITDPKSPIVEKLPVELSSAQGLVWKGDALYASVTDSGIYRLTDSNGDDLLDRTELLSELNGKGEHGNHALFDTRDSHELFAVAGNHTPLPATHMSSRTRVQSYAEDLLLPRQWDARGHAAGILAPGGWFTRFDLQKKSHELFCIGFRNQYDAAMNAHGDIFTYDSDMEWDLGLPWYCPTRICHVVSGGDFGWRSGSGRWPDYYEDTLPALVNIGPGSPTGVVSGQGTLFPKRYQDAVYALDWTYGRILAIHLKPDGASYKAESELFVSGVPLPVTDAVVGSDGALYFTTGGRGANSSLKRVVYTGTESTSNTSTTTASNDALPRESVLRRELEAYHGVIAAKAVEAAWPHLSSNDRFLRHAARVAIESQPVSGWAQRVASEPNSQARIAATVALARRGRAEHQPALLAGLARLDFQTLPLSQQLGLLRALSLTLERLGKPTDAARAQWIANLESILPNRDASINLEAIKLLVYLDSPAAVTKGMQLIVDRSPPKAPSWEGVEEMNARYGSALKRLQSKPTPAVEINYAFALRTAKKGWTLELRRKYFEFLNEAGKAGGGASYPGYLENTRDEALASCTDEERIALVDLTGRSFNPVPDFPITPPVGPGKEWTLEEALSATLGKKANGADFERGRNLFHAAQCGACHRFQGLGGGVGPDLTSVPNKFDTRYLIEAMINPSKDISDQYQSSNVLMEDGRTLSGLVIEQDAKTLLVYPSDPKAKRIVVSRDEVEKLTPSKVSQMPAGLLNSLNRDEIKDLTAYIMSGGNPNHKSFAKQSKK